MSGYEFQHWADMIAKFGFSLIALIGLGFFVWHIWKWVTNTVNPALGDCGGSLGKLKKQVQALDNDMIRLNTKLKILIQERNITDKHKHTDEERTQK
jgi:hypothetical protein|tara:strand:- start:2222 stop:2512 length:291 start_codon:yes stop_codon:yes gene_type:complete